MRRYIEYGWRLLRTTVKTARQHDCTDAAAAMAFDFVFAVFPALLVLSAFIGAFGISPDDFARLLDDLGIVLPAEFIKVVEDNIEHLVDSSQSLFFIGIVGVLWPASASMSTTMTALNRALGLEEMRSFWHRRILSIVLVMAFGLSLLTLSNLIVFSEQIEAWLRGQWPLLQSFPSLTAALGRVSGIVGALLAAASIYRYVPSQRQTWYGVIPGSLLFLTLWTSIVTGFRYYVYSFSYYNLVSGALGVVIVILLSAYLVAFTLLLGGELNAAVRRLQPRQKALKTHKRLAG